MQKSTKAIIRKINKVYENNHKKKPINFTKIALPFSIDGY